MNLVLRGLTWNIILAFLDDALVLDKDVEDHLDKLRTVFTRFQELDLKVKPKKYAFFRRRVVFLGRQVSPQVVEMGGSNVQTVRDWADPRSAKDVERFLGFANYNRGFIAGYAQLAFPLYCLTGKKPFIWGQEQQAAFDVLKKALTSPPLVLALPTLDGEFESWTQTPRLLVVRAGYGEY